MGTLPFALQLYTVRDHMDRDARGTLHRVREAGYGYVELAGTAGHTVEAFQSMLADAGLTAVSSHVGFERIVKHTAEVAREAHVFGLKYVVCPWVNCHSPAAWIAAAEELDAAGAFLRAEGIQLAYHNHAQEFERAGGKYVFDILFEHASPENLAAEIDTYWVKYGGADPVAVIRSYANRCPLLHIKDMSASEPRTFVEVGKGIMDWAPIFEAGKAAGTEWYIVELDECPADSLECAAVCAEFMKRH